MGVNNAFLVKSGHALAVQYGEQSPLEKMHCAVLMEVLSDPGCDVLATLTESQAMACKQIMSATILGTDMAQHFGQVCIHYTEDLC